MTALENARNFIRYWSYTRRVDGWLTQPEALLLFRRAIRPEVRCILEIGCWKGRSSSFFAQISRDYDKQFSTIDDFSGRGELANAAANEDIRGAFLRHMSGFRYALYHPRELATLVETQGAFDLVYIDGCHSYEAVAHDIRATLPTAKCIIGHDYTLPSVRRAVDELLPGRTRPVFDMWMWQQGGEVS